MTTIAHISDTHFGTEVTSVVQAAISAIVAIKPDVIVLSGDITQRARADEFAAALAFFDALPAVPRLVIPGNHDLPLFNLAARAFTPYRQFERAFGARESSWHSAQVGILGFDTTSRLRHKDGLLTPAYLKQQVAEFRNQLAPSALLFVAIHQPLHAARPKDWDQVTAHPRQLAQACAECQVDLVFSGHVHVPYIATTRAAFASVERAFVLSCAGTGVSQRVRSNAPNSFNVIDVQNLDGARKLSIRQFDFSAASAQFLALPAQDFFYDGQSWQESRTPVLIEKIANV